MSMYWDDGSREDFSGLWKKRTDLKRDITIRLLSGLIQTTEIFTKEELLRQAEEWAEFLIRNMYREEFGRLILKESE